MTSAQKALNSKKMITEFFRGGKGRTGKKAVGSGRYEVDLGKSKSGPCKICKAKAGRHNIGGSSKQPPYHPNCKCTLS